MRRSVFNGGYGLGMLVGFFINMFLVWPWLHPMIGLWIIIPFVVIYAILSETGSYLWSRYVLNEV